MIPTLQAQDPIAVTQDKAAKLLSVSDRTIRNWEKRGLVSGVRVGGGKKLYDFASLKALVGS